MARRPRTPVDGHLTEHTSGIEHITELIRHTVPPLHPAGLPFIAGGLGVAAAGRNRRWLRNTGLKAVQALPEAKALFVRQALGLSGDLPALARP